ncbi:phosphoribosylglycinamide formyltransferase [Altererythrobacter sp. SALINAS58]|uniref:phosphoribosylglycinamide formyltransferase n=1 Tax=Alteripontixanthobacter muriae TaxID=2705546 RepID=UPI00157713E5|nr:phosphoribosylglycinamide formyltransferase [Alteripontixanthobacter muriae]NTZ42806.1 phosphoribosylglycinamide formyltransferase [Alteripontixanthobacter muriae]
MRADAPGDAGPNSRKIPVAVLISGSGTNMAALLHASRLPDAAYEIVLVASNDPGAPGLRFAEAEGLPVFAISHRGQDRAAHDATMGDAIENSGAELVALAGYMRILTEEFVQRFAGRLVNIHPSLLPKYRGLRTHERALAAGDAAAGVSVHFVTAELDAGEVLGRLEVRTMPDDTPDTLAARVLIAEHQLYPHVVNSLAMRLQSAGSASG